jgi:hypothetical protein
VHAAAFVMRALADGIALALPMGWRESLPRAANVYILGYVFLAFRSAYGASRGRSAVDTAVTAVVYVTALVAATAVVVGFAMFGTRWLAGWGF